MRNNKLFTILAALCLMLLSNACSKDDIVFDHELPQFETREGAYLLEVIMPMGTNVDDDIYIIGAFNGGDSLAVVNNPKWKLEKCANNNIKWGIYLFPEDFVEGAILADGYTFFNVQQGWQRTLQNQPVTNTEVPALGGRINVTVDRWASYFETPVDPGEVEHDGYAIYVDDQTTWGALALYAWGDSEIFGGWPGAQPTGTIEMGGVNYKYFDTGKDNEGKTEHLIFNNNNGGVQLKDFDVVLDRDYYLTITDEGVMETGAPVSHDGYAIFIAGSTGWDAVTMYAWGDGLPELFGGWPGISPTGEQTINGVTYQYWDTGEANKGLLYNFILNNNNGGKQFDLCSVTLDKDYYYVVDSKGGTEIDPADPPVIGPEEPDPDPETHPYAIYVNTDLGWASYALYAWGDAELFGKWPGLFSNETKEVDGATYLVFPYEGAGETLNLILNNNGGDPSQQVDDKDHTVTADRDYYFKVTMNGWEEVNP